ncbi:MAG: hypothetical protein DI585_00870 [Pseudomonas fluorescens]|nr:MAG: hypothetical protein DI585_00870 [Pseudomonas fluorescens]
MTLTISAKMASIEGMRTQEQRVAKAANDINQGFTAAQNAMAADSVSIDERAAVVPAVEDAVRGAVLSAGDITTPIVDLLQAATAYKANAAAFRVSSDVEQTTLDLIGKRGI